MVRRTWMAHDEEFTKDMEGKLEGAIIARIKSGDIRNQYDMSKIRDTFATDYKSVTKFIENDKLTVNSLYLKTNAKAAHHARLLTYGLTAIAFHARSLRMLGAQDMINLDSENVKNAMKEIHSIGLK